MVVGSLRGPEPDSSCVTAICVYCGASFLCHKPQLSSTFRNVSVCMVEPSTLHGSYRLIHQSTPIDLGVNINFLVFVFKFRFGFRTRVQNIVETW